MRFKGEKGEGEKEKLWVQIFPINICNKNWQMLIFTDKKKKEKNYTKDSTRGALEVLWSLII